MSSICSRAVVSALAILAIQPAHAAYVYAPGAQYETQEASGVSEQGIIFTRGETTRMQLGFDSSLFGTAPISISEIAFRFDKLTYQYDAPRILYDFGRTVIKASTIADINNMSGTYADNLGADTATLLDREYSLISTNTGPVDGPRSWGFVFTFDTAFNYDPTKGDLILDLATGKGTATFATVDLLRSGKNLRQVFAYNGQATVGAGGSSFDGGPVSRLTVGPPVEVATPAVPEPATWGMMLLGFGATGAMLRRRRPEFRAVSA